MHFKESNEERVDTEQSNDLNITLFSLHSKIHGLPFILLV